MTALPDAERLTHYDDVARTAFPVGFKIFEVPDDEDQEDEIEVSLEGVVQTTGWTLLATFVDGESTTASVIVPEPGWTGEVDIRGARRPRRTTQFNEGSGVSAVAHNLSYNILTANLREIYDKIVNLPVLSAITDLFDFDGKHLHNIGAGIHDSDALRKDQIETLVALAASGGLAYSAFLVTYADDLTGLGDTVQAALDDVGVRLDIAETDIGYVPVGGEMGFAGPTAPAGWLFEYGQAISRTTYALLLNAITKTVTGTTASANATITAVSVDLTTLGLVGAKIEGTGIPAATTILSVTSNTIVLSANATATGSGISIRIFPHGNGNGTTTFNVPDDKGRVKVGRDDMGGTAASRMTGTPTGGIIGGRLGAAGGNQGHTMTTAQMPLHGHPMRIDDTSPGDAATSGGLQVRLFGQTNFPAFTGTPGDPAGEQIGGTGGGGAHNNVQPGRVTNFIIYAGV